MTKVVVDSSVAPKWWFDEIQATEASLLRGGNIQLLAPDLLIAELTNVVVQKVRAGRVSNQRALEVLNLIDEMKLVLIGSSGLKELALDLAVRFHPSAYDCLYAALAIREDCPVVTADRRFYDALVPHFPANILWIEDLPAFLTTMDA